MYDVRALANWVLDQAEQADRPVSNLALNKILYFMYFHFLTELGQVLTEARIEAWDHGPVFREVYHQFKVFKSGAITGRALEFDVASRQMKKASAEFSPDDVAHMEEVLGRYIGFDAIQLRELSHERGGAWDKVWNSNSTANPGMVISNDVILQSVRERILN